MDKQSLHNLLHTLSERLRRSRLAQWKPTRSLALFLQSWWHLLTIAILLVFLLYYPLGGYIIHHIDTNTEYEIELAHPEQSAAVELSSFLINREVNDKLWTANLPFFYPSYFLDNMPSFQQGIIKSQQIGINAMAHRLTPPIKDDTTPNYLLKAAELLNYPGTVWMFSPDNKLRPAPSSTKQYRKARRYLIKYNEALLNRGLIFYRSAEDLQYFLHKIALGLGQAEKSLSTQIREHNTDWFDTQADNLFYYNQGQAYGFFLFLKALGKDYQQIIVERGAYEDWTILLNALRNAAELSPTIVRNGELNSSFAPNHLSYLNAYLLKAQNTIYKIDTLLNTPHNKDTK